MVKNPEVLSIGVNAKGDSVIRIRCENGYEVHASTNIVSFARLAEAGVRVYNETVRGKK